MRRRLVLHAFALVVVLAAAASARAQPELPTDETIAVAEEAGVDAMDLQGAVNSTGLEPRAYLVAVGELSPPFVAIFDVGVFGLDPYLARVARCESLNFRPDVVYGPTRGRSGEIGLFQLHPYGLLPLFYRRGFTNPWDPFQQASFALWAFYTAGLASHWSCR